VLQVTEKRADGFKKQVCFSLQVKLGEMQSRASLKVAQKATGKAVAQIPLARAGAGRNAEAKGSYLDAQPAASTSTKLRRICHLS
jgi:hypothetical protein